MEKEKEKQKEEKTTLECFEEPYYDESLQALIKLGFPEEEVKNVTAASANDRGNILLYLR